jgi:hypothetical protein
MNKRVVRAAWLCLCLTITLVGLSAAPPDSPKSTRASDIAAGEALISPGKLKMHLSFIASDELEGRDTPSRGLDLAARYNASHMEYYGYQPAGDNGTYYQTIGMTRRRVSPQSKLKVTAGEKTAEFSIGADYVASGPDAKGQLVFAGFGLSSKDAGYDDYAELDVKDKLVVCLEGIPEGLDPNLFKTEQRFAGRLMNLPPNRALVAQQHGAVGAITIKGPEFTASANNRMSPFDAARRTVGRETSTLDHQSSLTTAVAIDMTAEAGAKLAGLLGVDLDAVRAKINETKQPQAVAIDASFDATVGIVEKVPTQNVCAFLEGSDPQLREEIVLFSAHYDHVGVAPAGAQTRGQRGSTGTDRIYNGADDDGSGTVGILNLAESFAAINRPRRSLLFIWHCGEEKGLWGSSYYVQNPTKPLDKIVANINIDMIGRNLDDKPENADHVHVIGASRTSTELKELIFKVAGDRMRLDETDRAMYWRRSDHFNYAMKRIPVAFFFTGEHRDYHQPGDEVHKIQFEKMKKILDIIFECGLELANRDTRPVFDGKGIN